MKTTVYLAMAAGLLAGAPAFAATATVPFNAITAEGVGAAIGTVEAMDSPQGLTLMPKLKGLSAGPHGFHVHEKPSCAPAEKDGKLLAGQGGGTHYDPKATGLHKGPQATDGHLGDLPTLTVAADGTATAAVVAPRLTVADLRGRSLMIHANGDNYSDQPAPLGGGGGRIACGIVP